MLFCTIRAYGRYCLGESQFELPVAWIIESLVSERFAVPLRGCSAAETPSSIWRIWMISRVTGKRESSYWEPLKCGRNRHPSDQARCEVASPTCRPASHYLEFRFPLTRIPTKIRRKSKGPPVNRGRRSVHASVNIPPSLVRPSTTRRRSSTRLAPLLPASTLPASPRLAGIAKSTAWDPTSRLPSSARALRRATSSRTFSAVRSQMTGWATSRRSIR